MPRIPSPPHVVVVGAGYAGLQAALRVAGKSPARVTLVNAAPFFVERVRLHQVAASGEARRHSLARFLEGRSVELVVDRVLSIEPEAQRLRLAKAREALAWDYLVYALGSGPGDAAVPGVRQHAHDIADEEGALRLHAALRELSPGRSVVVCGGGATAIEAASEIAETFPALSVTLASAGPVGPGLSSAGRRYVRATLESLGVEVREGAAVTAVEPGAVVLEDGDVLRADATLWAGGFSPSPLAREAGLATTTSGQLLVDPCLRSVTRPNVFGAGDSALPPETYAPRIRMGCATAGPMGAQAADAVLATLDGRAPAPFTFAYVVQCLSLGRRRGMIQRVAPDDRPLDSVLRGRLGALAKETVVKSTVWSFQLERALPGVVMRSRVRRPPVALLEEARR